jgi:LPPG:FO 2-phospho-L-lactate transferase
MREALVQSPAPVVAVSPIVGGAVLKGPTAAFMEHAGLPLGAAGIARAYAGVAGALLADECEGVADMPVRIASTLMVDGHERARVARDALDLACAIMESQ